MMWSMRWVLLVCATLLGIFPGLAWSAPESTPSYDIEIIRNIQYGTAHTAQQLDVYRPLHTAAPCPVVLAIHGGNWLNGSRRDLASIAERIAAHGYAVAVMDYRLAPEFVFPQQRDDARLAARWLAAHAEEYGVCGSSLYVLGVSAGAELAALLGTDPDPDGPSICGVMVLAGPMDCTMPQSLTAKAILYNYLGVYYTDDPDRYRQASPISHVSADDPPFFFAHGTADAVVPIGQAEHMAKALEGVGVPVSMLRLSGVGHGFPKPLTKQSNALEAGILAFMDYCASPCKIGP